MKKGIHPNWHHDCVVTCGCGNSFTTGSSSQTLKIDICSACHPFFTGEMRFVDRQGRVDRFIQKLNLAKQKQADASAKQTKKSKSGNDASKSYQEILREQQTELRKQEKAPEAAKKAE